MLELKSGKVLMIIPKVASQTYINQFMRRFMESIPLNKTAACLD